MLLGMPVWKCERQSVSPEIDVMWQIHWNGKRNTKKETNQSMNIFLVSISVSFMKAFIEYMFECQLQEIKYKDYAGLMKTVIKYVLVLGVCWGQYNGHIIWMNFYHFVIYVPKIKRYKIIYIFLIHNQS